MDHIVKVDQKDIEYKSLGNAPKKIEYLGREIKVKTENCLGLEIRQRFFNFIHKNFDKCEASCVKWTKLKEEGSKNEYWVKTSALAGKSTENPTKITKLNQRRDLIDLLKMKKDIRDYRLSEYLNFDENSNTIQVKNSDITLGLGNVNKTKVKLYIELLKLGQNKDSMIFFIPKNTGFLVQIKGEKDLQTLELVNDWREESNKPEIMKNIIKNQQSILEIYTKRKQAINIVQEKNQMLFKAPGAELLLSPKYNETFGKNSLDMNMEVALRNCKIWDAVENNKWKIKWMINASASTSNLCGFCVCTITENVTNKSLSLGESNLNEFLESPKEFFEKNAK